MFKYVENVQAEETANGKHVYGSENLMMSPDSFSGNCKNLKMKVVVGAKLENDTCHGGAVGLGKKRKYVLICWSICIRHERSIWVQI